jgi:2-oxoglutarate ferredoxin oxidoreductase subunit delta
MKHEIHIIEERCKGCGICVSACQSGVLTRTEETDSTKPAIPQIVGLEHCMGCGVCEMLCPDFAIWVTTELCEGVAR